MSPDPRVPGSRRQHRLEQRATAADERAGEIVALGERAQRGAERDIGVGAALPLAIRRRKQIVVLVVASAADRPR